jgi:hypothetical protein
MMDDTRARDTGRLALAVGAVAAGSAVCLATYFIVRGPFGTINDIGNATTGVLSGWLAWRLRPRIASRGAGIALGAALVGATITVVGSALVVSGTTGYFFAGLVSSVGFAGIGTWLVAVNRSAGEATAWPGRLRSVGAVAGALMAVGVVMVPGILLRLDDMATAPAWVWIGFLGWLGIYVAYPAWAIWMGTVELSSAGRARTARVGTAVTD